MIFGDALPGLKSGVALDHAPASKDIPNANLAFIAAVGVFIGSPILSWWYADGPTRYFRWYALAAAAGAVLFAVSRLFV